MRMQASVQKHKLVGKAVRKEKKKRCRFILKAAANEFTGAVSLFIFPNSF